MSSRREWIQWAGLGAASLGFMGRAWAAPYPEKPIKLIVPYPAGGGADQWARIVGGKAENYWDNPSSLITSQVPAQRLGLMLQRKHLPMVTPFI